MTGSGSGSLSARVAGGERGRLGRHDDLVCPGTAARPAAEREISELVAQRLRGGDRDTRPDGQRVRERRQASVLAQRWVSGSWTSVHPWGSGPFQNFADPDLENWADAYYGTNYDRLVQIKARYDPGASSASTSPYRLHSYAATRKDAQHHSQTRRSFADARSPLPGYRPRQRRPHRRRPGRGAGPRTPRPAAEIGLHSPAVSSLSADGAKPQHTRRTGAHTDGGQTRCRRLSPLSPGGDTGSNPIGVLSVKPRVGVRIRSLAWGFRRVGRSSGGVWLLPRRPAGDVAWRPELCRFAPNATGRRTGPQRKALR